MNWKLLIIGLLVLVILIGGCVKVSIEKKDTVIITDEPIIVKHFGGVGLLIAECANKTHIKENSDYIIEGIVEQVESKWNEEKTSIFTYTDLSIGKYVKGVPFETDKMEIITDGGCVDEICQAVEDTPILHKGKNVRIYFEKIDEGYSIVCGQFGVEETFCETHKWYNLSIGCVCPEGSEKYTVYSGVHPGKDEFICDNIRIITEILNESCSLDSDCELPMEYAVRSSCLFGVKCMDSKCSVVCPG